MIVHLTVVESAITIDKAVAVAASRYPEATLSFVVPPTDPAGAWVVVLRQEGEVRRSAGNTRLWIDQCSAEVLAVRDSRRMTGGDTFLAWPFPLHNGEAFGLVGRLIVFASGLAPAALAVTGMIIWWTKRRGRRRVEARRRTAPESASISAPRLNERGLTLQGPPP